MAIRKHIKVLSHQDIQTVRKLKSVFLEEEEVSSKYWDWRNRFTSVRLSLTRSNEERPLAFSLSDLPPEGGVHGKFHREGMGKFR